MEKFDQILSRMEEEYGALSGHKARDVSDTGLRLRILAGELYRLWCRLDWVRREAFPQTATGERLDAHGEQRGVTRKPAAHAQGTITFSRYLPMSFDLVIPKGTVCAVSGEEPVEYETTEEGVLPANYTGVDIPARAVVGGSAGNCAASRINTLISAPAGVNYCVNKAPFTGGADAEGDEAYRERILAAYAQPENGTNAAYYKKIALDFPGVTSAQVVPRADGDGTVTVYVWGEGAAPSAETIAALQALYNEKREMGVTVTVKAASSRPVNTVVRVHTATEEAYAGVPAQVDAAVRSIYTTKQVGDPIYVVEITRAILGAVAAQKIEYGAAVRDMISVTGTIYIPGNITVEYMV